jgi:hypothetical protein
MTLSVFHRYGRFARRRRAGNRADQRAGPQCSGWFI